MERTKACRIQGLKRLQELADHLIKGNLLHDRFNYTTWNNEEEENLTTKTYGTRKIKHCGTEGCAAGELPAISKDWKFSPSGHLQYKKLDPYNLWWEELDTSLIQYFCLDHETISYLFYPDAAYKETEYKGLEGAKKVAEKLGKIIDRERKDLGITCEMIRKETLV